MHILFEWVCKRRNLLLVFRYLHRGNVSKSEQLKRGLSTEFRKKPN